jgi:ribose/xylose/arabinose/galactoside ABC-type transport system permease subunit
MIAERSRMLFPSRRMFRPASLGVMGQKVLINLATLAVFWIVLAILNSRFLTIDNLTNVFRQISVVATVGTVVTLLMVSRNFDLSVGGVVALSGCVSATLATSGWDVLPAFVVGGLTGALLGLINGVLVVGIGINSVIATLGTMYLSRGSALLVTGGVPIYSVPEGYNFIGQGYLGPVPIPVIIMLLFVVVLTVVARYTLLGKYARATGSNPVSARLSGVPTHVVQFTLFVLAGAAAGFGGLMVSSRVGGGVPTVGEGFEFQVVVAAVLGGTSLAGGEGIVFGTLLGALMVGTLNNGLNLLGVPTFWQTVALGIVLVLAVALDSMLRRRMRRGGSRIESVGEQKREGAAA